MPKIDSGFEQWWASVRKVRQSMGMPLGPDYSQGGYNYKKLYKTGFNPANLLQTRGHFPSTDKEEDNPRAIVSGMNTKTGKQSASPLYTGPYSQKVQNQESYWKHSGTGRKLKSEGWDQDSPPLAKKVQSQISRAKARVRPGPQAVEPEYPTSRIK
jgi:hypothetical protein